MRYAVVGIGHISQIAVLPAFRHARNSELAAIISGDAAKRRVLAKRYRGLRAFPYESFEQCLHDLAIDAVYVALPNHLHREYAVRAAQQGVHVLCEKPMAVTEQDCEDMIRACLDNRVKLMIAYRLHFEEANLEAVKLARGGALGHVRIFQSLFSQRVRAGDVRLKREFGGGTLYDIGIYCINAARSIFRDEPIEGWAASAKGGEARFAEVDEMTSAVLRFPGDRLAAFTCSFGASDVSLYHVVGTNAELHLDPAYEYAAPLTLTLTAGGKQRTRTFKRRDQFAAELDYFSGCILKNREPEPSGREGLADVRIIRALYQSSEARRVVSLTPHSADAWPVPEQAIARPPATPSRTVHARGPSA
jgi:glucose-fructose oxidoreductase